MLQLSHCGKSDWAANQEISRKTYKKLRKMAWYYKGWCLLWEPPSSTEL